MTSNLASERIAEYGVELRNAARKAAERKLDSEIGLLLLFYSFNKGDNLTFEYYILLESLRSSAFCVDEHKVEM